MAHAHHLAMTAEAVLPCSGPEVRPWSSRLSCLLLPLHAQLGFDVADLRYPQWFEPLGTAVGASFSTLLPEKVRAAHMTQDSA